MKTATENRLFMIEDFSGSGNITLMKTEPLIEAKTGKEALNKYLKQKGLKVSVKCSADNNVHFGITPMINQNGQLLIDGRKRMSWYKIIN